MGLSEKQEEKVEKEVERRLRQRLYSHAKRFEKEFREQVVIAVSAALGFLIALSWREPISEIISEVVGGLGFGKQILWKFISAVVVTFLAVFGLVLLTRWKK